MFKNITFRIASNSIFDRFWTAQEAARAAQARPKTPQDHPRPPQDRPRPPQDRPRSLQDQVFIAKGVEKGIEEDPKPGNSRLLGHD